MAAVYRSPLDQRYPIEQVRRFYGQLRYRQRSSQKQLARTLPGIRLLKKR